ncbi:hypothetical protein NQ318_011697 [Aromia moschata]|uniref:Tetratricopeptide repeat protein 29 n=1 Tax=Aromia moschata TaxID=1265417 RepID=A0AAV8XGQ1_9CUCU|nr:hypothetical protein NQ318_011697 [Aromia moschata]
MTDNHIRRERRRKAEKEKTLQSMRAALPVYTLEEIRHLRLPFHEAMLKNLEDSGYVNTSGYIQQLFDIQHDIRESAGATSQVYSRPQLMYSKAELTDVCDGLVKVEDYHNAGDYGLECEHVLQMGVKFAFSCKEWWWLGEQLLLHALSSSTHYSHLIGHKYEALSNYSYGKFLIESYHDYDTAMKYLEVARRLSIDEQWTIRTLFPADADVLFLKVNYLIYTCLIRKVEILMKTDVIEAGKIALIAKTRASEACYPEGEITALMLKGMCDLSLNDTKNALATFTKSFYIQSKLGSQKGLCESRIHLAVAYLLDGDPELSLNTLLMLKESAEEYDLPFYLAQAYRHLGEYFLNNGEAVKATPLLVEAMKIFLERHHTKESEQVRNLQAISAGLGQIPQYIDVLSRSHEPEYMNKLIDWKDLRKPFTEDDESSIISETLSAEQVLRKSTQCLKDPVKSKSTDTECGLDKIKKSVTINSTPRVMESKNSSNDEEDEETPE